MKRRLIAGLILALMLVAVLAAPAMAVTPVEDTVTASVTVTEYINFTVTDPDPAGLQFGSLDPGDDDEPEANTPAVTLVVGTETNVDVGIYLKGDDFSDGTHTLAVSNVKYDDDNTLGEGGAETGLTEGVMATTYGTAWTTVTAGVGATIQVYHWISIPDAQPAGNYHSTFTYKAG